MLKLILISPNTCRTEELGPGEDTARNDQGDEDQTEAWLDGAESLADLERLPQYHGDGQEYWKCVVAVNI